MSKFQINFKGNKKQLHQALKRWTDENDRTMNNLIIELIENHINSSGGGGDKTTK